ncbi:MAG: GAF domain-containing protein, partial [Acidobacteriota bacterium]
VREAVRTNLELTQLNTRLDDVSRKLARKVRVMDSISQFGNAVSNQRDPAKVLRLLITEAIRLLRVQGASVIIIPGTGRAREAVVHGFKQDPLLQATDSAGASITEVLLKDKKPRLFSRQASEDNDGDAMVAIESAGFSSALAVPMMTQDKAVGLLMTYGDEDRADFDQDDLQPAAVLASTAAMGYANAIAWRQMQEVSRSLETKVEERTRALKESLQESRRRTSSFTSPPPLNSCDLALHRSEAVPPWDGGAAGKGGAPSDGYP